MNRSIVRLCLKSLRYIPRTNLHSLQNLLNQNGPVLVQHSRQIIKDIQNNLVEPTPAQIVMILEQFIQNDHKDETQIKFYALHLLDHLEHSPQGQEVYIAKALHQISRLDQGGLSPLFSRLFYILQNRTIHSRLPLDHSILPIIELLPQYNIKPSYKFIKLALVFELKMAPCFTDHQMNIFFSRVQTLQMGYHMENKVSPMKGMNELGELINKVMKCPLQISVYRYLLTGQVNIARLTQQIVDHKGELPFSQEYLGSLLAYLARSLNQLVATHMKTEQPVPHEYYQIITIILDHMPIEPSTYMICFEHLKRIQMNDQIFSIIQTLALHVLKQSYQIHNSQPTFIKEMVRFITRQMTSQPTRMQWFYEQYTVQFIEQIDFTQENHSSLFTDQLGLLFKDYQHEETGSRDILEVLKQRLHELVQTIHHNIELINIPVMAKLLGKIIQYKLKIYQQGSLSKNTHLPDFVEQVKGVLTNQGDHILVGLMNHMEHRINSSSILALPFKQLFLLGFNYGIYLDQSQNELIKECIETHLVEHHYNLDDEMKQLFIQRINYPLPAHHFDKFLNKIIKSLEEQDYSIVKLLLKSYRVAKHPLYAQLINKINAQAQHMISLLYGQSLLQFFYAHIEIMSSLSIHNQQALLFKVLQMDKKTKEDWLSALNFLATLKYDYYFQFDKYHPDLMKQMFSCYLQFITTYPNLAHFKVKYEIHLLILELVYYLKSNPITNFNDLLFFEQNYIGLTECIIESALMRFRRQQPGQETKYEVKIIGVLLELQLLSVAQLNQVQDFMQAHLFKVELSQLCRQYQIFKDLLQGRLDLDDHLVQRFDLIQGYYKFRFSLRFLVNNKEFNAEQRRTDDHLFSRIKAIYEHNSPSFPANPTSQELLLNDFQQFYALKYDMTRDTLKQ